MSVNRILMYAGCNCCRRKQREAEIERIAEDLDERSGVECIKIEGYDAELHLTIIASWKIDNPDCAASEIVDQLRETAGELEAAAERLIGGVA